MKNVEMLNINCVNHMFQAEIMKIICVQATLFCLSTAFFDFLSIQPKISLKSSLKLLQTEIKNLLARKKYFPAPMVPVLYYVDSKSSLNGTL